MASEAPPFWWAPPDWRARALRPVSALYGLIAGQRMRRARRERIAAPVLCVGNLTVGGTGKTPLAIAMAQAAAGKGLKPGFLSRGYGGSISAPHLVDPDHDSARVVGDEPILLAAHAPVAVTPNRAAGARLLIEKGCDFLIMDDGFQSARIHMDHALLVIDARYGLGNGHVIPGGPVRAPLVEQLRHASSLVKMGEGKAADQVVRLAARAGRPVYEASLRPRPGQHLAGRRFLAFAGIGHPEKFYASVAAAGGEVAATRSFPDHHAFTEEELQELSTAAGLDGLELITTAKDAARLRGGSSAARAFLESVRILHVEAFFDLANAPARIIAETLEAYRRRR